MFLEFFPKSIDFSLETLYINFLFFRGREIFTNIFGTTLERKTANAANGRGRLARPMYQRLAKTGMKHEECFDIIVLVSNIAGNRELI